MDRNKPPKKTETVEIRLPHATKTAFMARCRDEGRTASDAIRRFIDAELNATSSGRPQPRLTCWPPLSRAWRWEPSPRPPWPSRRPPAPTSTGWTAITTASSASMSTARVSGCGPGTGPTEGSAKSRA